MKSLHVYKSTLVRCIQCTVNEIISTFALQVPETLLICAKELHFLNDCSHETNKFLIQTFDL